MFLKKIHGQTGRISIGGRWNGTWNARETAGAKMEELRKCWHGVWHEQEVQAVEGRWGCGLTLPRESLTRLKKLKS